LFGGLAFEAGGHTLQFCKDRFGLFVVGVEMLEETEFVRGGLWTQPGEQTLLFILGVTGATGVEEADRVCDGLEGFGAARGKERDGPLESR
jgi:hypothetical protein